MPEPKSATPRLPKKVSLGSWLRWAVGILGSPLLLVATLLLAGLVYKTVVRAEAVQAAFALPDPNIPLKLPRDLAARPEFRTEWWRYHGQVSGASGDNFAINFSFTQEWQPKNRLAGLFLWPSLKKMCDAWFSITDFQRKAFVYYERSGTADERSVGSSAEEYQLRFGDWLVEKANNGHRLAIRQNGQGFELVALPEKQGILQGQAGYNWRGLDGAPVYFLTYPRMALKGTLTLAGKEYRVAGSAWLDHESTSYELPPSTIGWDRFSLQLENNHELFLLIWRLKDGTAAPDCPATLILPDGSLVNLDQTSYEIKTVKYWFSARTKTAYPCAWTIRLPDNRAELNLVSQVEDQELLLHNGKQALWMGPCAVRGTWNNWPITGKGFAELAGYRKPVAP